MRFASNLVSLFASSHIFRFSRAFPVFNATPYSHIIMRTHETRTEGVLDCTGALTVLATKLSAVAYNYQDGLTLLEEKDEGAQAKDEKERKELTEEQRRREERTERSRLERRKAALVTMPSVVQLMGYLFCVGLHITGPFFEFTASGPRVSSTPPSSRHSSAHSSIAPLFCLFSSILPLQIWSPGLKQPSVLPPFLRAFTQGALAALVFLLISPSLGPSRISDRHKNRIWSPRLKQPPVLPPFLRAFTQGALAALVFLLVSPSLDLSCISDRHKNRAYPVHLRWLLAHHASIVWRSRAYILWSITEAAMVVAGLGFSGWETAKREAGVGTGRLTEPPPFPAKREAGVVAGKGGGVKGKFGNGGESEWAEGNGEGGGYGDTGKQEGDKTCAAPAGKGKALWSRARNVDILGVEFPKSCLDFATKWNISYGLWLRLYVYERMVPPGRKFLRRLRNPPCHPSTPAHRLPMQTCTSAWCRPAGSPPSFVHMLATMLHSHHPPPALPSYSMPHSHPLATRTLLTRTLRRRVRAHGATRQEAILFPHARHHARQRRLPCAPSLSPIHSTR
ncbi:unnamed protein product [Closterium sp. Naga37s-1]|nr:unnamed protein product [Closterium sp. Naga37s-1]